MSDPQRLTSVQRVCVVIGFLCLCAALAGVAFDEPVNAAAVAFIGVAWLFASRLTYRD